jgi:hypothetical protein
VSTPKRRSLVVFGRPRSLQVDRKEEDAKEVQEICGEKNAEEMTKEYAAEEGENSVHSPTGEEKREDVMEWSHSVTGEEKAVERAVERAARCENVERSHSAGRKGKVLSNVRNIFPLVEVFGAFYALKSGYILASNAQEIWSLLVDMLPAYKPNRCNHRLRTPEIDWGRVAYRCMSLATYRYL